MADHHDHNNHEHHEHDHDHNHNEHDHEAEVVDGAVNVSHHEGALICSSRVTARIGYAAAVKAVERALKELAAWVDAHKGYVGHIKSSVSDDGRSTTLSTTGDELTVREFTVDNSVISMAAIVFAVPDDDFVAQFTAAVESIRRQAK